MLISFEWLKEYVDIDLTVFELANRLTMAGLEVSNIKEIKPNFSSVFIGKIISIIKHPYADKLFLCKIKVNKNIFSIICGAPNILKGQNVAFASLGALLPSSNINIEIKKIKIRGIESEGMLCSEAELGIGSNNQEIIIFDKQCRCGEDLSKSKYLNDFILDINPTPNRSDCLSIIGIAREIAILTQKKLHLPKIKFQENDENIEKIFSVKIINDHFCPRYMARVIKDVKIKSSPFWMKRRLENSGIKSINNVIDITNYVMLEYGQPLHAFDLKSITNRQIIVRNVNNSEPFILLNKQKIFLPPDILMIYDSEKPLAIAGVIGGLLSGVTSKTKTIVLESAYFNPLLIRKSVKKLKITTEASFRFERGIDYRFITSQALERATYLLANIAEGIVYQNYIDKYSTFYKNKKNIPILLNISKIKSILGISFNKSQLKKLLKRLNMQVENNQKDQLSLYIKPSSLRFNLTREIDIISEIARIYGYEDIPNRKICINKKLETPDKYEIFEEKLKTIFLGSGYNEVINYSFISPKLLKNFRISFNNPEKLFIPIVNPLSVDYSLLRTSLIFGLFSTMKRNYSIGIEDIRIFEKGKVFIPQDSYFKLPLERKKIAALNWSYVFSNKLWNKSQYSNFYDIKGLLENILENLNINIKILLEKNSTIPYLCPQNSSEIFLNEENIGFIGNIHPEILEKNNIKRNISVLELDLNIIFLLFSKFSNKFSEIPKYPSIIRDTTFIVHKNIEYETLLTAIKNKKQKYLINIEIIDFYVGHKLSKDHKSLTIRFTYRSYKKTLTDDIINNIHNNIINIISSLINAVICN